MMNHRSQASAQPLRSPPADAEPPEDQDAALLHRMADGDESALASLYDRWSDRVHTIAFWMLKDADDAEDVVEEAFWQAWRTAGEFDGRRASASTWLMMIARSRSLDRLRAQRRRTDRTSRAVSSTVLEALDGRGERAAFQPEPADDHGHLVQALGALPPEQRDVLGLAFFEGLSHSEIAARLQQPLGTVKTRIRLAMDKLRQKLYFLSDDHA
jgi:RNA polymerase sigma-70 factor, ECF subfamily